MSSPEEMRAGHSRLSHSCPSLREVEADDEDEDEDADEDEGISSSASFGSVL